MCCNLSLANWEPFSLLSRVSAILYIFILFKKIISGAAGVHFEDQLAAEKKCGHMGGKVLIPTSQFIRTLNAARLASDVLRTDTILIARTDANAATLLTSNHDTRDQPFTTGKLYKCSSLGRISNNDCFSFHLDNLSHFFSQKKGKISSERKPQHWNLSGVHLRQSKYQLSSPVVLQYENLFQEMI